MVVRRKSASHHQLQTSAVTNSESPPSSYRTMSGEAAVTSALGEHATVKDDGRVDIDLNSRLSRTLSRIVTLPPLYVRSEPSSSSTHRGHQCDEFPIQLNIVIQVVGSRGDVQPFIAMGNALQKHGHRVRLATHANFQDFVQKAGLEFYPIGGDPEELMSYMVRNPGLVPSMKSLRAGDIARKRTMVSTILDGCWQSCIKADPVNGDPFVADAIIANPPSFAHIHCAEALGVPLHIVFTMPWTGTRSFPHPLANITSGDNDPTIANYLSYAVVGWMTWQGLGDLINDWRHELDLAPVPRTEGPMLAETLEIPHTYCWSSALVPKPADWPDHIDVSGFFFRDAPDYKPPEELQAFLDAGEPPVYIGFGSIVLDDATTMSSLILDAVTSCGVRAIVSRGWSRLNGTEQPNIFWLEDCPHEWLFQHVFAVVHHGGAGTTACGLLNAKPTTVIPFFGDQAFWGSMVATAGAGPTPIPHQELTAQNLADAIRFCGSEPAQLAASTIAVQIEQEDGVKAAVRSFHTHMPSDHLACDILLDQPASLSLTVGGRTTKLSKRAAAIIVEGTGVNPNKLRLHRSKTILIENRRWDPVTGMAASMISTAKGLVDATTGIVLKPASTYMRERSRNPPQGHGRASSFQSAHTNVNERSAEADHPRRSDSPAGMRSSSDVAMPDTQSTDENRETRSFSSGPQIAGHMALASSKSLGKFFSRYAKGLVVDIPLATTEGFRSMPRLWGDEVKDYGQVTDWKSGGIVAGKSLVQGIGDGFRDLATQPVKGGQEGGAWGATKGVAKGTASLLTKTASGSLGLVAYPGQGISKSLYTFFHRNTNKSVVEARYAEGKRMAKLMTRRQRSEVLNKYNGMQQQRF